MGYPCSGCCTTVLRGIAYELPDGQGWLCDDCLQYARAHPVILGDDRQPSTGPSHSQEPATCRPAIGPAGLAAEALLAYGQASIARLREQPATCWWCGGEIPDDPDACGEPCPHCGEYLVPF
jgi:hypothetical protein